MSCRSSQRQAWHEVTIRTTEADLVTTTTRSTAGQDREVAEWLRDIADLIDPQVTP